MNVAVSLPFLTALVYGIVELIKSSMKAYGWFSDDDKREVAVRWASIVVGVLVTLLFQFSLFTNAPTVLVGIIGTGIVIGVGSDLLHVGTDLGKAAATNMTATPPPGSTSTKVETAEGTKIETKSSTTPDILVKDDKS